MTTRFPIPGFAFLFLATAACIDGADKDTAVDTAPDTADPPAVAFDLACDPTTGNWAVTAEAIGARSAWDTLATEVHGTRPGEVPLFFSEAHGDSCVTGVVPNMDCVTVMVQVRVQLQKDGVTLAQVCSAGQSAWADCPDTAAPSCPL